MGIVAASTVLVLLWPIVVIVVALTRFFIRRPVIFARQRIGCDG